MAVASPNVFVSYARADRPRVAKLAAAIQARGYKLWWDDHLEGGAAFSRTIEDELGAADAVIVVWSAAAVASDWVRDEAAVGRDRGVLVPVTLDGTLPPLGFRQYHAIDFARWVGRDNAAEVDALVRAIDALVGRSSAPVAPPTSQNFGRMSVFSAAAAVLVVLAAAAWLFLPRPTNNPVRVATTAPTSVTGASIAVLPFANLSGQAQDDYLSEGLAEQLRSTLASFSQIKVAARTSSMAFKDSSVDARTVAAKLGVAYILEGSVQRDRAAVRVRAQLIEAATGFTRWSQSFDRDTGDAFRIQDEISNDVADALKVRLLLPPTIHGRGGTEDTAALDAYLRGRQQYDLSGDEATYRAALAHFDAAIAADPEFAAAHAAHAAHAARARTLIVIGNQYSDGKGLRTALDQALVAARRAVALAPALADTQSTLGFVLYNRLDFAGASAAYDKAYRAGSDADQLVRYAGFKYRMGHTVAATAALDRAAALDPLNPRVPKAQALTALVAHRYPDAIAAMERALALNPKMTGAHALIGDALLLQGKVAAARNAYRAESQEMIRLTGLAIAEHKLGNAAAAKAAIAALVAKGGDNSLYQQAQVRAQWGDTEGALVLLTEARGAGDTGLVQLRSDPLLDPLRNAPRFETLLAEMKFVQ